MVLILEEWTQSNWNNRSEHSFNCCIVGKNSTILQGRGQRNNFGAYTIFGRIKGKSVNFVIKYSKRGIVSYQGNVRKDEIMEGSWSSDRQNGAWKAMVPSELPESGIQLETEVWKLEYNQYNRWHPFEIEIQRDGTNVAGFGADTVGRYTVTGSIQVSGHNKSLNFKKKYNTHTLIYTSNKIENDEVTVSGVWWQETNRRNTGKFRGKLGTLKKVSVDATADKFSGLTKQWMPAISEMKQNPPKHEFNLFLSHVQKDSQDTCRGISQSLKSYHKLQSWYDMEATTIDAYGMIEGIAKSDAFLLFATRDYFSRPWCLFEARVAQLLNKPIVIVRETDLRHGGTKDFDDFVSVIPKKFRDFLDSEILELKRRGKFWDASVDMIASQVRKLAGLKGMTPPPADAAPSNRGDSVSARLDRLESDFKEFRSEVNSKLDKLLQLMSTNITV